MPLINITTTIPAIAVGKARLRAIALSSISDGANLYPKGEDLATPAVSAIGGAIVLSIPSTISQGQLVRLQLEKQDASNNWVIMDSFDRIIPDTSTSLNALLPSHYTPGTIQNSHLALKDLLANDPAFVSKLSGFTDKTYSDAATFNPGDYTWVGDSLYRYISTTSGSGKSPAIAANVLPTVGAVWEKKATISVPSLAGYTQIGTANTWTAKQTFNGGVVLPDLATNSNDGSGVNSKWVQSKLSEISSASLTVANTWTEKQTFEKGAELSSDPIAASNDGSVPSTRWVRANIGSGGGSTTRFPTPVGQSNLTTAFSTAAGQSETRVIVFNQAPIMTPANIANNAGDINPLEDDTYRIEVSLSYRIYSEFDGSAGVSVVRVVLHRFRSVAGGGATGGVVEMYRNDVSTRGRDAARQTLGKEWQFNHTFARELFMKNGEGYNLQISFNGGDSINGPGAASFLTVNAETGRTRMLIWNIG